MSTAIGHSDPAGSDLAANEPGIEPRNDAEPPVLPYSSSMPVGPVTLGRVIKSEWVKLWSLRSTWVTLVLAFGALAVMGVVAGYLENQDWSHMRPQRQARFDAIGTSLSGITVAQLVIGVFGVLFVSGEYGTGMIRSTLGAVPRRLPVLWAKALLSLGVVLVLTEIASFIAFFGGQAALGAHGTTISAPGALRAVVGTGLYLTVVAVIGVGLGFILRSTAGGIATLVGILLVLPGLMSVLPQTWQDTIAKYLPSTAGAALWDLHPESTPLAPGAGFAVFCFYAALALAGAAYLLRRRDA